MGGAEKGGCGIEDIIRGEEKFSSDGDGKTVGEG